MLWGHHMHRRNLRPLRSNNSQSMTSTRPLDGRCRNFPLLQMLNFPGWLPVVARTTQHPSNSNKLHHSSNCRMVIPVKAHSKSGASKTKQQFGRSWRSKLPISVPAFTCIQLVHSAHSGDGLSLHPPLVFDGFVGVGNAVEADAGLLLVVASHVAHRRGVRSRLKESRPLRLAANTNWTCVI